MSIIDTSHKIHGFNFNRKLLKVLNMSDRANTKVSQLSTGLRQKMNIARGFLTDPQVLFLDEPTGGVDPVSRRDFWRLIDDLSHGGTTVLVTTHYLDEAEYCDRLSIMVDGRIAALGTPGAASAARRAPK